MDCYSGWSKEEVREVSRVQKMIGNLTLTLYSGSSTLN